MMKKKKTNEQTKKKIVFCDNERSSTQTDFRNVWIIQMEKHSLL